MIDTPPTPETRSPPSPACERCGHPLPDGPDPLMRPISPEEARRFDGTHQPARPVRVYRPETGESNWFCSSRCFKRAKPAKKTPKGKPRPDQHFHIRPWAA